MSQKIKNVFRIIFLVVFALGAFLVSGVGVSKAAEIPQENLPVIQFADITTSALESNSAHSVKVCMTAISNEDVSVEYSVGGTAVEGVDYVLSGDVLTIPAGEACADIDFALLDNHQVENDKSMEFTLFNPENAQLGENSGFLYSIVEDDLLPVTTLTTVPLVENGNNGWFTSKTTVSLSSSVAGETYFSLNSEPWQPYVGAITLADGQNTIEYYSVDCYLNQEEIQTKTFYVDTIKPKKPIVSVAIDGSNNVKLSWQKYSDTVQFQVWKSGSKIATLGHGVNNYIDGNLVSGQNYDYYIVAVDQAGNRTLSNVVSAKIEIATQTVETVKEVESAATVRPARLRVEPAISQGASIVATTETVSDSSIKQEEPSVVEQVTINPVADVEESSFNWSRLMLAISALIILTGIGVGVYYGYGWYFSKKKVKKESVDNKTKSRW